MQDETTGNGPDNDAGGRAPTRRNRAEWGLWQVMSLYERFEQLVAIVLSIIIVVIVGVALVELVRIVLYMVETEALNPLEQQAFQLVFGMIMTLLIALEFKHSIVKVAMRREGVIQVETVILIALIALARKFVVLDKEASPAQVAALALALLALGVVYWLIRERGDRPAPGGRKRLERGKGRGQPAAPGTAPGGQKE